MTLPTAARDPLDALRANLRAAEAPPLEFPGFRRAAVLVPLLDAPGGMELLFTLRSRALAHHAGQIAFPGGRAEPGESPEDAARRETLEEIGVAVPPGALLGRLPEQPSPARFVVTPVVALLAWPQPLRVSAAEVDEVFTVPLAELAGAVPEQQERQLEGVRRTLYFYSWRERLIWGMTGNILRDLLEHTRPPGAG